MLVVVERILDVDLYYSSWGARELGEASPNAMVVYNGKSQRLFVNKKFMHMPAERKETIVAHEIGHIAHEHVLTNALKNTNERNTQQEFEADQFATRIVGKRRVLHMLIDARDDIIEHRNNRENARTLVDLIRRIDEIEKIL